MAWSLEGEFLLVRLQPGLLVYITHEE